MPDSHNASASARSASPASDAPALLVIGSADTCAELMRHPQFGQADVVLLDLASADAGAPLIERLVDQSGVRIVVLAVARDPSGLRDALAPGAVPAGVEPPARSPDPGASPSPTPDGCGKAPHPAALMLRRRASGDTPRGTGGPANVARGPHRLTAKEREVVRQMVRHRGTKNPVIAQELGISEHTLRNHLTVIYSKLGVQGKLNLYVYALEHGLAGAESAATAPWQVRRWRPGDPDRRASRPN